MCRGASANRRKTREIAQFSECLIPLKDSTR